MIYGEFFSMDEMACSEDSLTVFPLSIFKLFPKMSSAASTSLTVTGQFGNMLFFKMEQNCF